MRKGLVERGRKLSRTSEAIFMAICGPTGRWERGVNQGCENKFFKEKKFKRKLKTWKNIIQRGMNLYKSKKNPGRLKEKFTRACSN